MRRLVKLGTRKFFICREFYFVQSRSQPPVLIPIREISTVYRQETRSLPVGEQPVAALEFMGVGRQGTATATGAQGQLRPRGAGTATAIGRALGLVRRFNPGRRLFTVS